MQIEDDARGALNLLARAYTFAQDAGAELWDFALEIDTLFSAGLAINDLRWLIAKRYAEHGQETSVYGTPHRSFRRGDGFFFDRSTCVVLTPGGASFVENYLRGAAAISNSRRPMEGPTIPKDMAAEPEDRAEHDVVQESRSRIDLKPCWDSMRRELRLDGQVVKRFRVPARNQELILSAFEEENWADHIDDPLPVRSDIDSRTRLHDAINRLNRCQSLRLLCFHGNGSGTGVSWTFFRGAASNDPRAVHRAS